MKFSLITGYLYLAWFWLREVLEAEREVHYRHLIFLALVLALVFSTAAGLRATARENRRLAAARAEAEAAGQSAVCVAGHGLPALEAEIERGRAAMAAAGPRTEGDAETDSMSAVCVAGHGLRGVAQ